MCFHENKNIIVYNITMKHNVGNRASIAYVTRAENITFDSIISEFNIA